MTERSPADFGQVLEAHGGKASSRGVRFVVGAATFRTWCAPLPEGSTEEALLRLRGARNWLSTLRRHDPLEDAPAVYREVAELVFALRMWASRWPRPMARFNDFRRAWWFEHYDAAVASPPAVLDTIAASRAIERARAALNATSQIESDDVRAEVQACLWPEAERLWRAVRAFAARQKTHVFVGRWPGRQQHSPSGHAPAASELDFGSAAASVSLP